MRLAYLRRLALADSSWRALSLAMPPITPMQTEIVLMLAARELGLIKFGAGL